jgi:hypothetical protein
LTCDSRHAAQLAAGQVGVFAGNMMKPPDALCIGLLIGRPAAFFKEIVATAQVVPAQYAIRDVADGILGGVVG